MTKPIIAVVGRPNVGKSTFFNRMAGRRIAIAFDRPGVTRDRIYADSEWRGKKFTLVDTGGLELKSDDEMWTHIRRQAELAIDTADVILFFLDAKSGLTAADRDVAEKLRRSKRPVVLAVNKMDRYQEEKLFEFYELGLGEPYGISAEQGLGIGDLLDAAVALLPEGEEEEDAERLKIALVGKPNAGKSSIANRLLGFDRTIVSDVAGTTRDAIDTPFERGDKKYLLIDTAGIRRKRSVEEDVEYYAVVRAFAAVRRADVAVAVIDAAEGLTEQDVKILGYVHEQGKPSVVAINKWDLIEKDDRTIDRFEDKLKADLAFMDYYRSVYVSAKTGKRTEKILSEAEESFTSARRRIPTGALNDVVTDAVRANEPPSDNGKRLKFYYAVQADVLPPSFVFFVNDPEIVHFSYKRYLENSLRRAFGFSGTPVRLFFRSQKEEGKK